VSGDDVIRVAAAGAGYFSHIQFESWKRMANVDLVAICNRNVERAHEAAGRWDIGHVFGDFTEMLDAVEPDLVDIITPEETHLPYVAEATARKIPTICQKPLGSDLDHACQIVEAAERNATPLIIHENSRWRPWFREAARVVRDGMLGTPHSISFRLRPGDGQGEDAYLARQAFFRAMEKFLIHETGIHMIDTFRAIMGEITGVFARLRRINPVIAGEDAGYLVFEFENGATGLYDGNRCNDHAADEQRLTMGDMWLEGSDGTLRLDGWGRLWWRPHLKPEEEHAYDWENDGTFGAGCVHALQSHVIRHLREGTSLENTGREYLRSIAVEEAAYQSAEAGSWTGIPEV
jgi:D-apiose dehydrogenase